MLSCEGQARLGHEVHLAFGPIYGPEGSLLERVKQFNLRVGRNEETPGTNLPCLPITTHEVPDLVREVRPLRDLRARAELLGLIARLQPDVVHTHSSKAGVLGRAAAWEFARRRARAGVRFAAPAVVHTIHGPPFMPIDGGVLNRLKRRVNNFVYTHAERFAAKRCHTIVSVADAMTRQFLARNIGTRDQYVTVRSGMETGPYLHAAPGESRDEVRAALGLAPTDFVIGTVARLAEHKGHDDLLDALAPDLKSRPGWKLLWVGDGWWRERLLTKARSMGLKFTDMSALPEHAGTPRPEVASAHIVLTGLVPPERVPAMVRAMDVLAHPSYREGLPRTVPQALLAGVCPLAYDVDGTGEICRDMQTGRLVQLADTGALRDAARWLYDHPDERSAMAHRGRRECAEAFSADRMVHELGAVYKHALTLARGAT